MDALGAAQAVLGTRGIKATVNRALEEVASGKVKYRYRGQ